MQHREGHRVRPEGQPADGVIAVDRASAELVVRDVDTGVDDVRLHARSGEVVRVGVGEREIALKTDEAARPGACLVRTGNGKTSFDNGLEARARRFENACRATLAEIYGS